MTGGVTGDRRRRTVFASCDQEEDPAQYPLLADVKRCSLDDGPGIRSVVFFKGCPLRCVFCHNPEAQECQVEIAFLARKCIACGRCAEVCPHGAIDLHSSQRILRNRCARCGTCSDACPTGALRPVGARCSPRALAELLLRDLPYYEHSGGGITLSGGEPTLFPDYVQSVLQLVKPVGVHVVLETCGHFHYETFSKKLLPYLDLIYYDIKIADPDAHQRHTGKTNRRILHNLCRLLMERKVEVQPRIPLVPGITATEENLTGITDLLYDAGAGSVHLLPYNPLGLEMFEAIGRPRQFLPNSFMSPDDLRHLYSAFRRILEQKAIACECPENQRSAPHRG